MTCNSNFIRATFESLVAEFGGVEAAAAVLAGRCGSGNKGTISKMIKGSIAVTVEAASAMEDACQRYPITEYLADRLGQKKSGSPNIMQLVASASRKHGDSVSAVVDAFTDIENGFDEKRLAIALMQARAAASEAVQLAEVLEGFAT